MLPAAAARATMPKFAMRACKDELMRLDETRSADCGRRWVCACNKKLSLKCRYLYARGVCVCVCVSILYKLWKPATGGGLKHADELREDGLRRRRSNCGCDDISVGMLRERVGAVRRHVFRAVGARTRRGDAQTRR